MSSKKSSSPNSPESSGNRGRGHRDVSTTDSQRNRPRGRGFPTRFEQPHALRFQNVGQVAGGSSSSANVGGSHIRPQHGVSTRGVRSPLSAGLSRRRTSELHQAMPSEATPQFERLSIESQASKAPTTQPEALSSEASSQTSSKEIKLKSRPGNGSIGKKCVVKANYFSVKLPYKVIYHYDVGISPQVPITVNRAVIKELVNLYKETNLNDLLPAYDGMRNLYTVGKLPFVSENFQINLYDDGNGPDAPRKEREFTVVIRLATSIDLQGLELFISGRQSNEPKDALQALDVVLRQRLNPIYTQIGQSFYSPELGTRNLIGNGLECWRGFYQSIRPTGSGLYLNVDISTTAFYEPLPVVDYVVQLLGRDVLNRPLRDGELMTIRKVLKGVKIEVTHRGNIRRKYRITSLTPRSANQLSFPVDEQGTTKTVVEYFRDTYDFHLQLATWPCLVVGNQKRLNYLPMEVCRIAQGQKYLRKLSDQQRGNLMRIINQRPMDRERDIREIILKSSYTDDDNANEFGIAISTRLTSFDARILPTPLLKYHDESDEKICLPEIGQWNMIHKKVVNGGKVNNWICINFSRNVRDGVALGFCKEIATMCQTSGMEFSREPLLPPISAQPNDVQKSLLCCYDDSMKILKSQEKELDLLIAILPDNNGPLYGELKRICETNIGLVSQCCLTKNVFRPSKQYLSNLALKINVKVGGRNTVLADALTRSIPLVTDVPTIIFGADVSHPSSGEDMSPSIAAVVASQDWPEATYYAGLVSAQDHRKELIQDLFKTSHDSRRGVVAGGMIRELLISFKECTGHIPQRIIFYRDGVSESQFNQVLSHELEAIRKACSSIEKNYEPSITFIVVQKRHQTRFFPNRYNDKRYVDRSGNVFPGTVVDTKICHPTDFDFWLCSHSGIQGTSRPTRYFVLWDENNFTADQIQSLTNNLCYTYARCTRAVSLVPPVYYAHLAAYRGRYYMETDTADIATGISGTASTASQTTRTAASVAVTPLPALKENIKKLMFYC